MSRQYDRALRAVTVPLPEQQALMWASRQRWLLFTAGLSVVLAVLGALYLFGAFTVSATSRPYAVVQILPGGMQTHGAIMLALGLAEVVAVSPTWRGQAENQPLVRRLLLYGTGPYLAWTSLAFLLAPLPLAHGTWNLGWIWPGFGAFTAYLLSVRPYPTHREVARWLTPTPPPGE